MIQKIKLWTCVLFFAQSELAESVVKSLKFSATVSKPWPLGDGVRDLLLQTSLVCTIPKTFHLHLARLVYCMSHVKLILPSELFNLECAQRLCCSVYALLSWRRSDFSEPSA